MGGVADPCSSRAAGRVRGHLTLRRPDLNATAYTELTSWVGPVSQTPLLRDLSDAELMNNSDTAIAVLHYPVGPFMEWIIHMYNGIGWIMGGYGKMWGK